MFFHTHIFNLGVAVKQPNILAIKSVWEGAASRLGQPPIACARPAFPPLHGSIKIRAHVALDTLASRPNLFPRLLPHEAFCYGLWPREDKKLPRKRIKPKTPKIPKNPWKCALQTHRVQRIWKRERNGEILWISMHRLAATLTLVAWFMSACKRFWTKCQT